MAAPCRHSRRSRRPTAPPARRQEETGNDASSSGAPADPATLAVAGSRGPAALFSPEPTGGRAHRQSRRGMAAIRPPCPDATTGSPGPSARNATGRPKQQRQRWGAPPNVANEPRAKARRFCESGARRARPRFACYAFRATSGSTPARRSSPFMASARTVSPPRT